MFIAFLAAAAASQSRPPTPIAIASWFDPKNYPAEALNQGQQGTVGFDVEVDAHGKATACKVRVSSGSASLDRVTCDLVRAKGQFKPATASDGSTVVGTYAGTIKWRLENPQSTIYRAWIFDFAADPQHPTCTIVQSEGQTFPGPTCQQLLQNVPQLSQVGGRAIKVVQLMSIATGNAQPYQGESDWGERVSFLANEQYQLSGPYPQVCIAIAAEGLAADRDPCQGFPGARTISDDAKKTALKTRMEISIFGVRRYDTQSAKSHGTCKTGESKDEAVSCN